MIEANELRLGNIVTWNPRLTHPNNTLPPMQVEVASILPDRISYVFPNIENRVEPFEDDVAQNGVRVKLLEELEPISLTKEMLVNAGFEEKSGTTASSHFEIVTSTVPHQASSPVRVKYFHQLQNLYFAWTGEELEIKLHGQQA